MSDRKVRCNMADYVYMEITKDKYELPVAIARNEPELAKICHTTVTAVKSGISKRKCIGKWSRFVKVDVSEVDE